MIFNRLAAIVLAVAVLAPMAAPLEARTRKGDKLLKEGQQAEARKEFDTALDLYEQALMTDPMDAAYQLAVNRVRFQAGQTHVTRGRRLRDGGNLEAAVVEFQKAFAIDPSSTIAEQELRQTNQMLDAEAKRKKQPGAEEPKAEQRGISPTQAARRVAEERAAAMKGVAELRPLKAEIINLKIVNQNAKVLFETVGKLAGINVLFDSEFQTAGKTYSIDLARTTLADALDYVALLTKSFWKPLSANTIFVTTDNVTKRRDYEEHVSRVFYLQNITSAQELQEVMTAVRQVTDVRKIFPVNSQSALIIRGTADQMALAEKVILDLDKPKPEVVVDVMVFEASRTVTRDLGLLALSTGGINVPVNFTPQNGTTGAGTGTGTAPPTIRLNQLGSIGAGDFTVTLPGASLQALLSDGRSKILQSPQVRATDGQKATVKIGQRYPYASGSFQSALGGVGGFPAAQTQFQFAEVGVNVDLTPRIHGSDEVSIQISLEISNITERINVGGVEQPVIGQRRVEHIIRVKEGEATLIGGLMQASDRVSRSGIPGLMNIPGLGRLLSSEKVERSDNDLLVVLVPHVVRYPEILPENLKPIASGTETIYKVSYEPRGNSAAPQAPPAEAAPAPQPGPAPALPPSILPPAMQPRPEPAPEAPPPPPAEAPGQAGISGGATAEAPVPAQPVKVVIRPSSSEPMLNALVTVNINIENVKELFSAPMKLSFDPKVLKLLEVRRGPFMAGDGAQVTFDPTKLDDGAIIGLGRVAGAGGMSGTGTLVTLLFQAVGRGTTPVAMSELTLRDTKLETIEAEAAPAMITVK